MGQPRERLAARAHPLLVFGRAFTQRLVTQMYFPGDPLLRATTRSSHSVRDPKARALLVASFDLETTQPDWALGYRWDIVLGRGGAARRRSRTRDAHARRRRSGRSTRSASRAAPQNELVDPDDPAALRLLGALLDGAGRRRSPTGWSRSGTRRAGAGAAAAPTPTGRFSFVVTKPEALPGEAPRLDVFVFARGLLRHQLTRIYFPDEPANESDPVLAGLDEDDRATLVADRGGRRSAVRHPDAGRPATVFFAH